MTSEENKDLVRRLKEEVINNRNASNADKFFAETFSALNPIPGREPGLAGLKKALDEFFVAFPDIHETVEEVLGDGDKVALLSTIRATHGGRFMGIEPTGKRITFTINEFYTIRGGKIQTGWVYMDLFGFMQQVKS